MHPTRRTRIHPKGLQSPLEVMATPQRHRENKGSICRYNMLDSLLKASPLRARERGPQPSAWKGNSANFALTEFSEAQRSVCRKDIHDRAYLSICVTSSIGAGLCRVPGREFSGVAG